MTPARCAARHGAADAAEATLAVDAQTKGLDMDLEDTATVLPEIIACPEPTCLAPAEVTDRFVLASTDGPVEHVRTRCLDGHGFTQMVEALATWPVTRVRRPLGASG
jgi:hypothetical protein